MEHLITDDILKIRINNRLLRMGLTHMPIKRTDIIFELIEKANIKFKLYDNIGWSLKNNTIYYCDICNNLYKNNIKQLILRCKHTICIDCERKLQPKLCPFCRFPIYNDIDVLEQHGFEQNIGRENYPIIPYFGDITLCDYIKTIILNNIINILLVLFFILVFVFIFWTLIYHKNSLLRNTTIYNNYNHYNLIKTIIK